MQKLIVGFSYAPTKAFSKLIRWVTNSQVSHAFVVLETSETTIYQASGLAVNYQNKGTFLAIENPTEFYEFDLTDAQAAANQTFRLQTVGKPYSWQEVIGYGWVLLARKFGKRVRNPYSGGQTAYVCVDIAAAHLPIDPQALGDGSWTPEDLRLWCQKNGRKTTVSALAPSIAA
jgi:hypothetical protein